MTIASTTARMSSGQTPFVSRLTADDALGRKKKQNVCSGIVFTLTDPQQIEVNIEGQTRRTFRCGGHPGPWAPLQWVEWPASRLGIGGNGVWPVYMQRHAIRRLEERLREVGASAVHHWMWESLRKPRMVNGDGNQYTIEYRFFDHRLGYLLARRLPECVVITPFVFLTMQGTPEARLLHTKLRLLHSEIEYQKLDELSTFTATDLLDDPELRELFSQCGCGHLDGMRNWLGQDTHAYAAELRKYLRLDEEKHRQKLAERLELNEMSLVRPEAKSA